MTVVHTDYLKSHLATKQEAQLKKVEQSAIVICENFENFLIVRLTYLKLTPPRINLSGLEFFVLSRLDLVSKMPILSL